eukprot:2906089-Lingulodinium_polyedra.AAC.1
MSDVATGVGADTHLGAMPTMDPKTTRGVGTADAGQTGQPPVMPRPALPHFGRERAKVALTASFPSFRKGNA